MNTSTIIRTTPITLTEREHCFVVQVGPWPFTRTMSKVEWLGKTDEEVAAVYAEMEHPAAKLIVAKLRRET